MNDFNPDEYLNAQEFDPDSYLNPQVEQGEPSIPERIMGGLETAATVGSSIAAEPIAGWAGIIAGLNPFREEGTAADVISATRDMLTYSPHGKSGQMGVKRTVDMMKPVADMLKSAEDTAEQSTFNVTNSPLAASLARALPSLGLELLGMGAGKKATASARFQNDLKQATKRALGDVEAAEQSSGVRQMTSDVLDPQTRVGRFFQQQGELVAPAQRANQQVERIKAVDNLLNQYDVTDGARFEKSIVEGLRNSVSEFKAEATRMFDESTGRLSEFGEVPITGTKRAAQDVINKELRKGTLADVGLINEMKNIIDAPNDMTFDIVKSIRSSIGQKMQEIRKGAPVQGNTDLGLQKRLYGALSGDMSRFAEMVDPDLHRAWKEADSVYSEFATGSNKAGAKRAIKDGDATPEVVDQLLFSKKKSDLDFLSSNLDLQGKQAARQRILQKILVDSSRQIDSVTGEPKLNPNAFKTGINKMRAQVGEFFTPAERDAIFELRNVLSDTFRAQEAATTTPTGQSLVPMMAIMNPFTLIPGGLQAIIETPKIRNILIKRKAVKSAKERNLLDAQLQRELQRNGIIGAGTAAALTPQQEQN